MRRASRRGRLLVGLLLLAAIGVGCTRRCVPLSVSRGDLIDLGNPTAERAPYDPAMSREVAEEFRRRAREHQYPGGRPYQCLSLSGGGVYGSFGIGVLNGWTESGQRPQFDIVCGISTGAMIATFAFLGPDHDALLAKTILEEGDRRDLMWRVPLLMVPFVDAMYTSRPLARKIRRAITPEVVREVAAAHAAGRRLYVGTTNLDAKRLVIWDMGAIASQGTEESLDLYREIILASGAVPMALPAVRIPVEINGVKYQELHADGGVSDEILFRSHMIAEQNRIAGRPGPWAPPGSVLHVIDNGKVYADPGCVKSSIFGILGSTASTVLYGKTRDELHRIYMDCLVTGTEFRLTFVPQEMNVSQDALRLTRKDREELFQAGRRAGSEAGAGPLWHNIPPPTDPSDQELPRAGTKFSASKGKVVPCECSR